MRRTVLFGILSLLLAGGAGAGAYCALGADAAPPVLPAPIATVEPENHGFDPGIEKTAKWMGVATCASSACHHENGRDGAPRSEYTTWKSVDPHARAFGVLYAQRSDHIMRNLYGAEETIKPGDAAKRDLCLKCHSSFVENQKVGDRFAHNDGVGCESCHGPAEKWLTSHYQTGFKGMSLEAKAALGMRPTKDLLHRTKLCASCHVGDSSKDVNHDLIAAGHPRLAFEMAGFQAIYPRHWQFADEKARHPDFEARVWALGQVVTAKASLELLEARAEGAAQDKRVWPEFAEYNCYKCHQRLQVDSPAQKALQKNKRKLDADSGTLVPSTWNYGLAELYPAFVGSTREKDILNPRSLMKGSPKEVADNARNAARRLDGLLIQLRDSKAMPPDQVRGLLQDLLERGIEKGDGLDWDESAQLYLGIKALHRSLGDRGVGPAGAVPELSVLGNRLRDAFPAGSDSPSLYNPLGKDTASTIPEKYPDALSVQFKKIRNQLGK